PLAPRCGRQRAQGEGGFSVRVWPARSGGDRVFPSEATRTAPRSRRMVGRPTVSDYPLSRPRATGAIMLVRVALIDSVPAALHVPGPCRRQAVFVGSHP